MIEELLPMRELILKYHLNKEYNKSIKACISYLENILSRNNINDDLWFCYYLLSYNYYLIKEYKKASEYAKYAAFSINKVDLANYNRTVWHLANCYRESGNEIESIKMYYLCAKHYRTINKPNLRMLCLYNIAKLRGMVNIMEKILYQYIKVVDKEDFTIYEQNEYEMYVLEEMCNDLISYYSINNKTDKLDKLINSIHYDKLKCELSKSIIENLARFK